MLDKFYYCRMQQVIRICYQESDEGEELQDDEFHPFVEFPTLQRLTQAQRDLVRFNIPRLLGGPFPPPTCKADIQNADQWERIDQHAKNVSN